MFWPPPVVMLMTASQPSRIAGRNSRNSDGVAGRTAVVRVPGVQVDDGRAGARRSDRLVGDLPRGDRQVRTHRRRVDRAGDRAGDDDGTAVATGLLRQKANGLTRAGAHCYDAAPRRRALYATCVRTRAPAPGGTHDGPSPTDIDSRLRSHSPAHVAGVARRRLASPGGARPPARSLFFLAGPKDHGAEGRHEYEKDLRILAAALGSATNLKGYHRSPRRQGAARSGRLRRCGGDRDRKQLGSGRPEIHPLFPPEQQTTNRTYDQDTLAFLKMLDGRMRSGMGIAVLHYANWVEHWVARRYYLDWTAACGCKAARATRSTNGR